MPVYGYVLIIYLVIINIISLIMYVSEAIKPTSRLSAFWLIVLPIIGGSLGACIANYFCDTEYRELRSWLSKFLFIVPSVSFIIQCSIMLYVVGPDHFINWVWNYFNEKSGWIGCYLIVTNIFGFIFVIVRKISYYIAPHGNYLIPDMILIPVLILGGATGGVLAKVLFNFKEDWSCNAIKEVQNFVYNIGMFIISGIHIGLYVYFFFIR